MEQYIGNIKVTSSENINPFLVVELTNDTIKTFNEFTGNSKVVSAHVTEVDISHLCVSLVMLDQFGNMFMNSYVYEVCI